VIRDQWRHKLWIIDGHNTIFALPELHRLQMRGERRAARSALEAMLRPFAAYLDRPLTIVYDGNQIERNPEAGVSAGIRVLFSQWPEEEADDRVVFLAEQARARGEAVAVVTNDQRSLAARLPAGAQVLAVEEFQDRCLRPDAPVRDDAEKRIAERDRQEIEAAFLGREEEIADRARRGVRRRERDLARLWRARAGGVQPPSEPGTGPAAERDSEEEPAHRWTWVIDGKPAPAPRARADSGRGVRDDAGSPEKQPPAGQPGVQGQVQPESPEAREARESPAAREAREARRRRGQRKQARRLEQMRRNKGRQK
jgi:predicted RNA-binding protein with PIN domain